jgi:amidase
MTGPAEDAITRLDAVGQSRALSSGQVHPGDLVEAGVARVRALEPHVGALVHQRLEQAVAEASAVDPRLPFAGVPVVLKDSLTTLQRGLPYYAGSRVLKGRPFISTVDSPVGALLRGAGFVTLGISKVPELAWMTTTQPLAFGATRNPWSLARSVGGSSGGSAAAVASGMVPIASGVENGGSIRIPASFCGVVGLKPTRGTVPLPEPHLDHLLHAFVLTRSVRDASSLLDLLSAQDHRAWFRAVLQPSPPASTELPRLRVGIARTMGGFEAHPDCQRALDETVELLEEAGCDVRDSMPSALRQPDGPEVELLSRSLALFEVRQLEGLIGRRVTQEELEPFTWWAARPDEPSASADQYFTSMMQRRAWALEVLSWWEEFDILVTPTVSEPPPLIEDRAAEGPEACGATEIRLMAYSAPFDETGQPAITLPLHTNDAGLPIGVQLVADLGRDRVLLQLAARLEAAKPWAARTPTLRTLSESTSSRTGD